MTAAAHDPRAGVDRLDRLCADAAPAARVYLRPVGITAGRAALEMVAERRACVLAGGPLAMTGCEVRVGSGSRVRTAVAGIAELRAWAEQPTAAGSRVAELLQRIEAARAGAVGPPRLMGIVNVTPDSFSDGGEHLDSVAALAFCDALVAAGADILDIGGESTRPGAAPPAPANEAARVHPVLEALRDRRDAMPGVAISIDTRHASAMRIALATGVDIINDVTALTGDSGSLAAAASRPVRVVLMHMQGTPQTMNAAPAYEDVALDVFDFLEARIAACGAAGIGRERLIVDPGIGFGKRGSENLELLRALTLFHGLGCPILLGVSRKGLGVGQGSTPKQRTPASLAAAMHALSQGVQILRVHDVAETRQVVELWRHLAQSEPAL